MGHLGLVLSTVVTVIVGVTLAVIMVRNWRAYQRDEELPFTGYSLAVVFVLIAVATALRRSYEAAYYLILLGGMTAVNEWQRRRLE